VSQLLITIMAKKTETTPEETPTLVTVKVTGQPVCEDGKHYAKGETFQTTPERSAALAGLVEIATA
jgi:hypothetical protein